MKERVEKRLELGFLRDQKKIVGEMEDVAGEMEEKGYHFVESRTDPDMKAVVLVFEREIGFPNDK